MKRYYECISCGNKFTSNRKLKKCSCGYDDLLDMTDEYVEIMEENKHDRDNRVVRLRPFRAL